MAGIAFGRETASPDIVFLHATGFNAHAYRAMLAPLGQRYHVLALDLRGHGRTNLPPQRFTYASWGRHRDDVIAVLEQCATAPVTLAGHSLGGTVALLTTAKRPDMVASLALIDPVILPPFAAAAMHAPLAPLLMRCFFPLARNAARRRARFTDRESAIAAFTGRGVFKAFTREMIEDYVADGVIEDGQGAFKLACAPAYEAATFSAHRNRPWRALKAVSQPLVILRAEKRSTLPAALIKRVATLQPQARIATVEGAGHMLPMERPDRVRAAMETAMMMGARDWGLGNGDQALEANP